MKPFDPTDPNVSAFLLGELPPEEHQRIGAWIEASPEGRAFLSDLESVAHDLTAGLATESATIPGLGSERAARVAAAATPTRPRPSAWWLVGAAAAAAAVALMLWTPPLDGGPVGGSAVRPSASQEAEGRRESLASHTPMEPLEQDRYRGLEPGDAVVADREQPAMEEAEVAVGAVAEPAGLTPPTMSELLGPSANAAVPPVLGAPPGGDVRLVVGAVGQTALPRLSPAPGPGGVRGLEQKLREVAELKDHNEAYDAIVENPFVTPGDAPLSTFSLDVDTASYANVRRFLESGQLPPENAVRIEELLNYFRYQDPEPGPEHPVAIRAEMSTCPWNLQHRLVRIGVRAKDIPFENRPPQNLVFLIDVSGSMDQPDKLPLLQQAFQMLVKNLGENDRVAIVVYASATGLVLPSTSGMNQETILDAIQNLKAGGSTNGGAGVQLAYQTAVDNLIRGGNNRVILATDGDFNVGVTDRPALIELIQAKAKSGVFLSVLGFGQGNLKDATMEQLADQGNGSYHYIDSVREAEKVLVRELGGTLLTVAKDVKLQVEFNPVHVSAYRLIGYENRALAAQDFNNDRKDAGDMGAGHTVTALYEIVPSGQAPNVPGVDPLRYQAQPALTDRAASLELLNVRLRYKLPDAQESQLMTVPLMKSEQTFDAASEDLRFSAAVAAFGMLLRDSQYRGTANIPAILEIAAGALGQDPHGDRRGFVALVIKASELLQDDR